MMSPEKKKKVFVPIRDATKELTQIVLDNQIARSEAGIAEYRRQIGRPRKRKK
jgi:hypothetical protein